MIMVQSSHLALAAALALDAAFGLQIPLQLPLTIPRPSWPLDAHPQSPPSRPLPLVDSESLQAGISGLILQEKAKDLYKIAKLGEEEYGNPTRVIGSQGHLATLSYIVNTLEQLGDYYTITQQPFPATTSLIYESRLVIGSTVPEAIPMRMTPPTKNREPVFAYLILIDNGGCDPSDYPEAVAGNIAFVERGSCSFGDKSELAGRAGAVATVIYNNEPGELQGNLGAPSPNHVATFGIAQKDAKRVVERLRNGEGIDAIAFIDSEIKLTMTHNLIAQTTQGDPENCVMLGGHSDSVETGPGINDDGSGSLSVLEVARQLSKFSVNNCVRFAWWSGEEEGLLGSDYYVSSLSDEENKQIRLFMDYDMMASPNFAYQIYDATNEENPTGSAELKQLYVDWYRDHGLNYTFIPFDGRSDYDGFIRNGIPGGGIATGAEGVKTHEEVDMFGGTAHMWYDPCYHELCDDLGNVNLTAWEVNTKLIAHSVATYARSFEGFPERTDVKSSRVSAYAANVKYHGNTLFR